MPEEKYIENESFVIMKINQGKELPCVTKYFHLPSKDES